MSDSRLAVVILAAGQGTRMKSALPKVLHRIANRPMIQHVLAAVAPLAPARIIVVIAPGMEPVAAAVAPAETAVQMKPRGTGHAVMSARPALDGFAGDVLVLNGDAPLVTTATLRALVAER
jgi:bifunctional UDP-N-acetylglucosamine pyrophosphorylase / glucosamine-1-phosphate N-acetyltransferase